MKKISRYYIYLLIFGIGAVLAGCSSTSAIPEGEQLFTGLKHIKYQNYEKNDHAVATQEEMENLLASTPNGALFGSSYYHTPFPIRLWIWNAFSPDSSKFSQWVTRAFGTKPKLMSQVKPDLRTLVAENHLKKFGYFNGKVTSEVLTQHNPKKAKIQYTVDMGHLWTIDSIQYVNFPPVADSLIESTKAEAVIKKGAPFSVPDLESERQRVTSLFRNNGYYYYQNGYASYLADTINVPGKALLRFQMADSIEERVSHKWYIGRIKINFRKQFLDQLEDSLIRRHFSLYFNGKHPPIRTGVILRSLKFRSGQPYSYANETESRKSILSTGLFSYSNMTFAPRDTTASCDTLDLALDLVFDKPYDFYIEANAKGKTSGRIGPELVLGFTKRNAFRGGEKLDINLHGSYEWTTGHRPEGSTTGINSYEYGGDISLTMPRLLTPRSLFMNRSKRENRNSPRRHHTHFYGTPMTVLKASMNILNRADYFKRHVVSGELSYDWWKTAKSHFQFSPLSLSYEYMQNQTEKFKEILANNPYLQIAMRDQFVPKMSFAYTYTSPATYRHPITWKISVSEAGNVLSGAYAVFGEKWSKRDKTMFKNPYAQFLKIESNFVKQWTVSDHTTLVGHLDAGVVWSYGNAERAPYYEQFYVGGANSIRAFNVRSIGPGKYVPADSKYSYIDQTGDVKFLANFEYRPRLFGNLYGAVFLDAGNVWTLHKNVQPEGTFKMKNFFKQMAVGTGIGLRYDLGMFVIRLDWGVGLHVPYETSKRGFYNIDKFADAQSIHLAVGYPF